MKNLLITHTDLDGVATAIVAKSMYLYNESKDNFWDVIYCESKDIYKQIDQLIRSRKWEGYGKIVFVDLPINQDYGLKLNALSKQCSCLRYYDHHLSSQCLDIYPWVILDVSDSTEAECGASLFAKFESGNCVNDYNIVRFIEAVRNWDTWGWQEHNDILSKDLSTLFKCYSLNCSKFVSHILSNLENGCILTSSDRDMIDAQLEYEDTYIGRCITRATPVEFHGKNFIGVVANEFISMVGNMLSEAFPEYEGALVVHNAGLSFRTVRDDVDLSEFCQKYGGGGHRKAAGISFQNDDLMQILKSSITILEGHNNENI